MGAVMPSTNGTANEVLSIPQRLLTLPKPARYLRCTLRSVLELLWKGQLPHTQFGKRFQADRQHFDEFLDRQKKWEGTRPAGSGTLLTAMTPCTCSCPTSHN